MATAATLNPEPSLPAEPKHQHLPPKSHVDVAEERLDAEDKQSRYTLDLYAGQGEDTAPRSPRKNLNKKSASSRINGISKDDHGPSVLVDRFEDKEGEHLVSIKQAWDVQKGERSPARRNSELVSGRKAGAGWEQSQYGSHHPSHQSSLIANVSNQYSFYASLRSFEAPSSDDGRPRTYP